jgi:hypothetical protein
MSTPSSIASRLGLPMSVTAGFGQSLTDRVLNLNVRSCDPAVATGDSLLGRME